MTDFSIRIVLICPEEMRDDANSFAMVTGYGPQDGETFGEAMWQDGAGNRYSIASLVATPTFPAAASTPLNRPAWDEEPYQVNMAGARRAQAALVTCDPGALIPADPARLLAVILTDTKAKAAHASIAALGIEMVQEN